MEVPRMLGTIATTPQRWVNEVKKCRGVIQQIHVRNGSFVMFQSASVRTSFIIYVKIYIPNKVGYWVMKKYWVFCNILNEKTKILGIQNVFTVSASFYG
jgi:hypothetical protein